VIKRVVEDEKMTSKKIKRTNPKKVVKVLKENLKEKEPRKTLMNQVKRNLAKKRKRSDVEYLINENDLIFQ
jgi:3-methyladenine DNA glycosylase AlkC